ncbi:MAG: hypothetical protein ACKOCK_07855 [Chloroflexota bacterium]
MENAPTGPYPLIDEDPLTFREWLLWSLVLGFVVGTVHWVIATFFPPVKPELPKLAAGSAITGVVTFVIAVRVRSWWWWAAPAVIAIVATSILTTKDIMTDNLSQEEEQVFLFRVGLFGAWWVPMSVAAMIGIVLGKGRHG